MPPPTACLAVSRGAAAIRATVTTRHGQLCKYAEAPVPAETPARTKGRRGTARRRGREDNGTTAIIAVYLANGCVTKRTRHWEGKKGTVCAHKDSVEVGTMARSKVSRVNVVLIAIENAAQ